MHYYYLLPYLPYLPTGPTTTPPYPLSCDPPNTAYNYKFYDGGRWTVDGGLAWQEGIQILQLRTFYRTVYLQRRTIHRTIYLQRRTIHRTTQ